MLFCNDIKNEVYIGEKWTANVTNLGTTGTLALTGQVQEFIVPTPEPGSLALLISGILALAAFAFTRSRVTA